MAGIDFKENLLCFIVCTLPNRNISKLEQSFINYCKKSELFVYNDISIPTKYSTTTRYELAYDDARKRGNYKYYHFMADDVELTPNYEDNIISGIEEAISRSGDRKMLIYGDDGIHKGNLATHYMVTKEWCDALGYFMPINAMKHCWCDNYLTELGKRTGRIAYCESAKLIHHHHIKDKSIPMDEWQQKAYSKEFYEEDKRRYEYLLKTQLQDDINKLLQ